MTKNYQPQRWLPSISPPKKTFGSILLSTPPVENIRKLSLWKKNAGFFTASGCFPPSPGPKKTPSSQTMGLVRVWVVDGYFQSSSWVPGKKIGKGGKTPWQPWKTPGPEACSFIARFPTSTISHESKWITWIETTDCNWYRCFEWNRETLTPCSSWNRKTKQIFQKQPASFLQLPSHLDNIE